MKEFVGKPTPGTHVQDLTAIAVPNRTVAAGAESGQHDGCPDAWRSGA